MIIDDNMTMVSRAARINPQYEGKGLYKMLDDNLALWAKSRYVNIKAQTTTEHNKAITRPSFQEKNQRVVSRVCIPYFLFVHERELQLSFVSISAVYRHVFLLFMTFSNSNKH